MEVAVENLLSAWHHSGCLETQCALMGLQDPVCHRGELLIIRHRDLRIVSIFRAGWEEPEDGERLHKVSSDRELSRILVLGQASLCPCLACYVF